VTILPEGIVAVAVNAWLVDISDAPFGCVARVFAGARVRSGAGCDDTIWSGTVDASWRRHIAGLSWPMPVRLEA
jgi:hypothetical protein